MAMELRSLVLLGLAMAAAAAIMAQDKPRLREPWQSEYSGKDATGAQVVALWHFNTGAETKDASGHGHDCKIEGAKINPAGRFGGALESFRGWPNDPSTRHAATVPNHPDLSPQGAFTLEMWIKPGPKLEDYPQAFLLDKRYVSDADYQIILGGADKTGLRHLTATLGFGGFSRSWLSQPLRFEVGQWYHVAFVYDGAGTGRFYVNGAPAGEATHPECGSIARGKHHLSIGDRVGSYYHGFPGLIDEVRICRGALEFAPARVVMLSERWVFVRREKGVTLRLRLDNLQREPLSGARLSLAVSGYGERTFDVPTLEPGASHVVEYPLDTSLRPDDYRLEVTYTIPGDQPYVGSVTFPVSIVARPTPNRMPVLMWGIGGTHVEEEAARLKALGFTHCLGLSTDYQRVWDAGKPVAPGDEDDIKANKHALNVALHEGIAICTSLSPGSWARKLDKYLRIKRDGKPYDGHYRDVCGLFPEIEKFCYNVGASVAQTYHAFPALQCALIHTEVRDAAQPCFHDHDRAAFREFAGFDLPAQVGMKWGMPYQSLPGFPPDRVIPDDHPLYVYYKWYWKKGDGWPGLNTDVVKGLKTAMPPGFWTFHDPAVRVASVYGSGGKVDVLSQWTYSYPDPIRIATATDELLAMAAGADPPQQVMKMTQIIWYRSQTAPAPEEGQKAPKYQARWEREQPDAPFITIAPMHLREAFWTKIARPIRGIMYHGWQSLVPTEGVYGYRYTNPETKEELRRLTHTVVQPLGPTLLQVPGVRSDVAYLESFAAEMFARRGTYGWGHTWLGDGYLIMQWAHLQPEIVYDETVVERGLDQYKVLVMFDCDVLTRSVVEKVKAFQARGGIVIGDERLCPAIKPDILVQSYERTKKAQEDKKALQERAAELARKLAGRYERYVDCSNPDVVVYRRRYADTDYVFAINDAREYGKYVGHHGLVMEQGLPSEATVTLARPAGVVYDLVEHQRLPAVAEGGKLKLRLDLGPCDGRLLMVTDRAVADVKLTAPHGARRGDQVTLKVEVVDEAGKPLSAVVPLQVEIRDPEGRPAEFSGYYGAAGGRASLTLDLAPNDVAGVWEIRARELASGKSATAYLRVSE